MRAEKTHEDLYQLGQDIFLYAIDKENLLDRGQTYIVRADGRLKAPTRSSVARLMAGDNPDPEPGGWPRLAAVMHNQDGVRLDVQDVKLGEGKLVHEKAEAKGQGKGEEKGEEGGGSQGFQVAHLTGTTKFNLREEQRAELKDFVHKGGTLVVDAAGGSSDFAASAEKRAGGDLRRRTRKAPAPSSRPRAPVYQVPGAKIEAVRYRPFVRGRLTGEAERRRGSAASRWTSARPCSTAPRT